jgi:hypothetical protein
MATELLLQPSDFVGMRAKPGHHILNLRDIGELREDRPGGPVPLKLAPPEDLDYTAPRRDFPMTKRALLTGLLIPVALAVPSFAQNASHSKILGGYFEEWSIYYANYNIANMQQNGVAGKLTHLMYAFANVSTPTRGLTIKIHIFPASAAFLTQVRCTAISPPFSNSNNFIPICMF